MRPVLFEIPIATLGLWELPLLAYAAIVVLAIFVGRWLTNVKSSSERILSCSNLGIALFAAITASVCARVLSSFGARSLPVHAYGFFIMLGFVVGSWIAAKRSPRVGVTPEFTLDLSLWVMLAGIIGSRVFYVAQYRDTFVWAPFWNVFDVTDGGLKPWGVVIGWLLPLAWYAWRSRDPQRPKQGLLGALLKTLLACFAFGIVIGRTVFLIQQRGNPDYSYAPFRIDQGGIVFYGGLFGAVAVAFWYIRRHKQSIAVISDLFIPEVALGYGFTRIGCFLNGCCWGHPTDLPWAIRYPGPPEPMQAGSPAFEDQLRLKLIDDTAKVSLPVHPSQLYAVAAGVAIFFLLSRIWKTNKVPGRVLAWFLLTYPIYRFLAEMTRGDEAHDWFGLTISQFISVCMFVAGIVYLAVLSRRPAPTPQPIAAVSDRR